LRRCAELNGDATLPKTTLRCMQ